MGLKVKVVSIHRVLSETAQAIGDTLDLLNIDYELTHVNKPINVNIHVNDNYTVETDDLYIIADIHHHQDKLPKNYIALQNEQPGSIWLNDRLMKRFDGALGVWDFCKTLNRRWCTMGYNSYHVPMRTPLKPFEVPIDNNKQKDIDILFYGGKTVKRTSMEASLKKKYGTSKKIIFRWFDLFEEEREDFISRAKIVLNIRNWEEGCLQTHRIEYLLARGKCIVSDRSGNDELDGDYESGIHFCENNDNMIEIIDRLLNNPNEIMESGIRSRKLGEKHQFNLDPFVRALSGCILNMN